LAVFSLTRKRLEVEKYQIKAVEYMAEVIEHKIETGDLLTETGDLLTETGDLLTETGDPKAEGEEHKVGLSRVISSAIVVLMVTIPTVYISGEADRIFAVLLAQVLNGLLLPILSICLLLCINDTQFMKVSPQPRLSNILLITTVTITMFLAANVISQKVFPSLLSSVHTRMVVAAGTAGSAMLALCLATSVGRNLIQG